jgi:ankyrin repeat protein
MAPDDLSAQAKNAIMNTERSMITKLMEAARQGDRSALHDALTAYHRNHSDLSYSDILLQCKDGHKRTVLHFACQSLPNVTSSKKSKLKQQSMDKDVDIVEHLLHVTEWWGTSPYESHALQTWIRLKDKDGLTPLMLAAQVADPMIAERRVHALLHVTLQPASTETTKNDNGQSTTAAPTTAYSKLALARSHAGATALHYAAGAGATANTIHTLVEQGRPALHAPSKQGGTPLHWACAVPPQKKHSETIRTLLECGANINAHFAAEINGISNNNSISNNTSTSARMVPPPFIMTLAAGNEEHAILLLKEAASHEWDLTDTFDYILEPGHCTAWHIAADMNMFRTLRVLIEESQWRNVMKISIRNSQDMTPLDVAAYEKHAGCVLLLLSLSNDHYDRELTEEDALAYIRDYHDPHTQATSSNPKKKLSPAVPEAPSQPEILSKDSAHPDIKATERQVKELIATLEPLASTITAEAKAQAQQAKLAGNDHFSMKEWQSAIVCYTKAIRADPTDATLYSNRSASYIMLQQQEEGTPQQSQESPPPPISSPPIEPLPSPLLLSALSDALMALHWRPTWSKASYRVAVARMHLQQFEEAAVAAWEGIQHDSEHPNEELKQLLQTCVEKGRHDHQTRRHQKQSSHKQQ